MTQPNLPSSPPRVPKWMWVLALASVLAVGLGLWRALDTREAKKSALQESAKRPAAHLLIPASEWLAVEQRVLTLGVPITGNLTAIDRAVVKARVAGELRELQVREGDSVSQGQVIARVDATEADARFRQAKLQADAAQAQVLIQQRQHDNNRALVGKGFISETALATSSANLQAAQANYAAARASQDSARKNLDDTVLRSPIHGQIARRMVQNGERVNVEAPIVEVISLAALELEAQIPANESAQVQVGQQAKLQLRTGYDASAQSLPAQVVRINPSASASNRAVPVYLRLQPPADVVLRPGMYVEGFIQTAQLQVLAIPLTAVRTDQPLPYVQTVHDGSVQHTPVTLGRQSLGDSQTWVAVQGLQLGQQFLRGSAGAVPAGTLVRLQPASSLPVQATP